MIHIISLSLVLIFGFQQNAASAEDLGTYSSCFSDHMLVEVDLTQNPDLVPGEIHLNDVNCKATATNATFAAFKIPLSGCGTVRDGSDPRYLFFSNSVRWSPKPGPGQLQTRMYDIESRVTCRYARNGTVSVSIRPEQETTISQTVYGSFSFSFEVYSDLPRQNRLDRDEPVLPGTPLYFRVQVISPESDLVLHLSRCWARNRELVGPDPFIEKGCNTNVDGTLVYGCDGSSPVQDFHLDAFRILNSPDDFVFFLCDVIVCLENAGASICKERCDNCTTLAGNGGGGKRRRSLDEEEYDSGSKTYSLAVGPFSVKEKDDGKEQENKGDVDETESQPSLSMVVILCVTALVAVGMICTTIIVVILYKKWSAKQQAGSTDRDILATPKPIKPKVLKL